MIKFVAETVMWNYQEITDRMKKLITPLILLLLLLLNACTEENEDYFASQDFTYYPIELGKYNQYDVTEINIDAPSEVYDTSQYQLKELIGGTYIDNVGRKAYMFVRYKRPHDSAVWSLSDVWSVQINNHRLFLTEENIEYVKIYFPADLQKSWDGNAYNTLDPMEYEVTGVDEVLQVNGHMFDSVLTVTQKADSSLIHKDYRIEQFARDTGLIYKEITTINSQEIEPGVPLEERITTGSIFRQTFVKRGKDDDYEF